MTSYGPMRVPGPIDILVDSTMRFEPLTAGDATHEHAACAPRAGSVWTESVGWHKFSGDTPQAASHCLRI